MRFFKAFVLREEMINTLTRPQSSLSVSLLSGTRGVMGRSARYAKTTGDESDDYIRTRSYFCGSEAITALYLIFCDFSTP